ncbi:MAG: ZIP family metal transporter [Cytophagales bacterium]|nr:ZIP family metal transporter [Cytophagales bacterium]
MFFNLITLYLFTFGAGMLVFVLPSLSQKNFRPLLTFSGAYLFSITVIHVLPELFHETSHPAWSGIWVLAGFFLQMLLEFFSEGVEHGHMHTHGKHPHGSATVFLLISLCIHSFLEGTLLVHPTSFHDKDDVRTLMAGMMVHKFPEAFALTSVVLFQVGKKWMAIVLLALFSMATPAGMFLSDNVLHSGVLPSSFFEILFPLVAGNFLYISTTIFFESGPEHTFKANKVIFSSLGAICALMAEWLI